MRIAKYAALLVVGIRYGASALPIPPSFQRDQQPVENQVNLGTQSSLTQRRIEPFVEQLRSLQNEWAFQSDELLNLKLSCSSFPRSGTMEFMTNLQKLVEQKNLFRKLFAHAWRSSDEYLANAETLMKGLKTAIWKYRDDTDSVRRKPGSSGQQWDDDWSKVKEFQNKMTSQFYGVFCQTPWPDLREDGDYCGTRVEPEALVQQRPGLYN